MGVELRAAAPGSSGRGRLAIALAAAIVAALALAVPAGAETRILAVGDVGQGGAAQERFGAAVRRFEEKNPADLLVTLGDNDYTDDPAAFRANWKASFGWLGKAGVAVAGALGDHDVEGQDSGVFQYEILEMPGPYYTRVVGDVEIFVLDGSSSSGITDGAQRAWFEGALAHSTARWKVVVVHRPAYTCGRYRGSVDVENVLVPLFERYGVQLVLSGDDHNYQRFEPSNGVTYIVDGAGNSRLYGLESCPRLYPRRLASGATQGFLYLVANQERLDGYQIATTGERVDHFSLHASPSASAEGDAGYRGPSFEGARRSPSGSKPESKLWWNDGSWWGSLFDVRSGDFHIFRLDETEQRWRDTGTPLDPRVASRADTLWDGRHLYVASHVTSERSTASPSLLYRFSYRADRRRYILDDGFPTRINAVSSKTLVIDLDSTGTLWATWVENGKVMVNRTVDAEGSWGAPFVVPVKGVEVGPDISSVIAFDGDKVGVFWGSHKTRSFFFAVHEDGRPAREWSPSEEITDLGSADDHVNLKSDSTGRVYAVVKTTEKGPSDTLISLLVRDPDSGEWSGHTVGTVFDDFTRAICVVDEEQGIVFVITTRPVPDAHEGAVQMKMAPIDSIYFEPGVGIPVIRDVRAPDMSDATSTKQPVTSRTGLVILASNNLTRRYWHSFVPLETSPLVRDTGDTTTAVEASGAPTEGSSSPTAREMLTKAAPALLVAFGLPLWLLAFAAIRSNRGLALVGTYGITLVAAAAGISLALALLVL